MQGSNVVEGFGLAGQAERLLSLPGPFHVLKKILCFFFFFDKHSKFDTNFIQKVGQHYRSCYMRRS